MDVFTLEVDPSGIDEVREWLCYTKPIGQDLTTVVLLNPTGDVLFSVHAVGNQTAPLAES